MPICSSTTCAQEAVDGFRTCPTCRARGRAFKKARRKQAKDMGLCIACLRRPSVISYTQCLECRLRCRIQRQRWGSPAARRKLIQQRAARACTWCGKTGVLAPRRLICSKCKPRINTLRNHSRQSAGLCGHCGARARDSQKVYCSHCLRQQAAYYKRLTREGLCQSCRQPLDRAGVRCIACNTKMQERNRRSRALYPRAKNGLKLPTPASSRQN